MKRTIRTLLCLISILLLFVGCMGPRPNIVVNPETRSSRFTTERAFDSAFVRAVQTFASLGGSITSQDAKSGTVSATVHNALNMTVTLNRVSETKTEVSVYGSTMPGKMIVGTFTEVEDYQRIYLSE